MPARTPGWEVTVGVAGVAPTRSAGRTGFAAALKLVAPTVVALARLPVGRIAAAAPPRTRVPAAAVDIRVRLAVATGWSGVACTRTGVARTRTGRREPAAVGIPDGARTGFAAPAAVGTPVARALAPPAPHTGPRLGAPVAAGTRVPTGAGTRGRWAVAAPGSAVAHARRGPSAARTPLVSRAVRTPLVARAVRTPLVLGLARTRRGPGAVRTLLGLGAARARPAEPAPAGVALAVARAVVAQPPPGPVLLPAPVPARGLAAEWGPAEEPPAAVRPPAAFVRRARCQRSIAGRRSSATSVGLAGPGTSQGLTLRGLPFCSN